LSQIQVALLEHRPDHPDAIRALKVPLASFGPEVDAENHLLKRFLREQLYQHPSVHRVMVKARRVVRELFQTLFVDTRLLPQDYHARIELAVDDTARARIVADYIAGMTDRFALDEHERLHDLRRLR